MADRYFAYGSNMSRAQMAVRCPGAAVVDRAVLGGHRFVINRRGVATVVPDAAAAVHGVLWTIGPEDERALDRYEGVAEGLYRRERCRVTAGGRPVDALVYVAAEVAAGVPRAGYLELIVQAAEAHGLPAEYVRELGR
ncbi:MAG: gamma-glutamylcyclotransferase family protein [Gemmatimonadales bacterium]